MDQREKLQLMLETVTGSSNVYFLPPPNAMMKYPCVIYEMDMIRTQYADNHPYVQRKRYQLTVIDSNPDGEMSSTIATLPMCRFDRTYKADNLKHDIFTLYF